MYGSMRASAVGVWGVVGIVWAGSILSCEGETREGVTEDGDTQIGEVSLPDTEVDTVETSDLVDVSEVEVEVDAGCAAPGGDQCPCEGNGDCNSGACVPTSAGVSVCTRACEVECQPGWECRAVAISGTDPTFLCVERALNLCRPCRSSTDCAYPGFTEPGDRCVDTGAVGGAFCGNACDEGGCPDGYRCEEVRTLGSDEQTRQCVPETGECLCSGRAVVEAADTACARGACLGRRVCEAGGLTACDALEASAEVCDGVDNDCSGGVDEGFGDLDTDQLADCVDPDDDGDEVGDETDLCPRVVDPEQRDGDGDGRGDACDAPEMPVMVGTEPMSPANMNTVRVVGRSELGAAVALYADANCVVELARVAGVDGAFSIETLVADNTTTVFFGKAFNGEGRASACSNTSATYVEDSIAPAVPSFVGTTPSSPSLTITNPIVTGLAEGSAVVKLYREAGCAGEVVSETETGAQGVFLASVSVDPGTSATFFATATDAAGNTSGCTESGITYTHLVGVIETTITSGPSNPSTSSAATFWFLANTEGATFVCRLSGGVQSGLFTACGSPLTFSGLTNANYVFEVVATSRDGVSDPTPARFEWVIDTTPPQTTWTSVPSDPNNDRTPTFGFAVNEAGSTTVCRVDGSAFVPCTSPWTTATLSDGPHVVYVLATDAAGNQEPVAATHAWRVDTDTPETTLTPAGLVSPSPSPNASFVLGSDETGTFVCTVDGASRPCSANWSLTGLGDGPHTVTAAAVDSAGNVDPTPATFSWVSDTTAPETTFVGALPTGTSNETQVVFRFASNDPNASFECRIGGGWDPCVSPRTLTLMTGTWTFEVRAIDAAGNRDPTPASHTFVIDATPPDTMIVMGPPPLLAASDPLFIFESNAPDLAGFLCSVDGGPTSPCPSQHTVVTADGEHVLSVAAVDSTGNIDPTPATWRWTVDTVAPGVPTGLTAVGGNRQVSLNWNPVAGAASYRVSWVGAGSGEVETTSTSAIVSGLPNCRSWSFTVQALDEALNASATSLPATAQTTLPAPSHDVIGGHGLVSVKWTDVEFADAYRIHYGSASGGPYVGTGSSSGPSPLRIVRNAEQGFALRGLPADDNVFVRVSALDGTCESALGPEHKSRPYPWRWVSPTPTGNSIRGVACVLDFCVAVGNAGTVLWKQDEPWARGNGGTGEDFIDVTGLDQVTFFAIAGSTIHRSVNIGRTFEPVFTAPGPLYKVRFAGTTGWAVGAGGRIFKSTNSGMSWVAQNSTTTGDLYAVWALNANEAWAAGVAGKILFTSDGGTTWASVDGPTIRTIYDLVCGGGRCLAVGDQGTFLQYAQGAWTARSSGTTQPLWRVVLRSTGAGVAIGANRTVLAENNGGWSVSSRDLGLGNGAWFGLAANGGQAVVGGEGGSFGNLFIDEGAITSHVTTADLRGLAGRGAVSVAVGAQAMLRSSDGINWTAVAGAESRTMYDVVFADNNTVYTVGTGGTVLKSTNAGTSFSAVTSGETQTLRAVTCVDPNQCWVAGDSEILRKTSNGGTSWSSKLGVSGTQGLSFVDANNGFLVVDNRYVGDQYTGVLYSIDGGDTWTSYHNYSTGRGLSMAGATSGFYVGNSGSNYCQEKAGLSTGGGGVSAAVFELVQNNGAASWRTALTAGTDYAGDCFFGVAARTGGKAYAVGTQGVIGRDLSTGWVQLPAPTRERDLFDVREVSSGVVLAVGERGTIILSETGGL